MDPYMEQRLRDEVMYLHSLWHKGPPNSNPNPKNPNSNPRNNRRSSNNQARPPPPTPALKQVNNKKIKKRGKRGNKKLPPVSDIEWPCNELTEAPSSSSGWPIFNPAKKIQPVRIPSAEEQIQLNEFQSQEKALKVLRDYFKGNVESDGDEHSDDDNDDDMMDEDGNDESKFFIGLFEENGELKDYYEKNRESGKFSCLVCGGIGEKVGKKFTNCVALVQHSVKIMKTKKKKAHRAYAQVICEVLGWDINKLPAVTPSSNKQPIESTVTLKGNTEVGIGDSDNKNGDLTLATVEKGKLTLKEDSDDDGDEEDSDIDEDQELPSSIIPETSNVVGDLMMPREGNAEIDSGSTSINNIDTGLNSAENGKSNLKEESDIGQKEVVHDTIVIPGISNCGNDEMMICESSLEVCDASKSIENTGSGAANTDVVSSGLVKHLECRKDDGVGNEIENNEKDIVVLSDGKQ